MANEERSAEGQGKFDRGIDEEATRSGEERSAEGQGKFDRGIDE